MFIVADEKPILRGDEKKTQNIFPSRFFAMTRKATRGLFFYGKNS